MYPFITLQVELKEALGLFLSLVQVEIAWRGNLDAVNGYGQWCQAADSPPSACVWHSLPVGAAVDAGPGFPVALWSALVRGAS